jgi:hypothetical protein
MDAARKKQLKTQYREQRRKAALAALPLPVGELKAMFSMLEAEFPQQGCDRTRRLTEEWLRNRGHDVRAVFAWPDGNGGYCDCEVLANCEEEVREATKGYQIEGPFD